MFEDDTSLVVGSQERLRQLVKEVERVVDYSKSTILRCITG